MLPPWSATQHQHAFYQCECPLHSCFLFSSPELLKLMFSVTPDAASGGSSSDKAGSFFCHTRPPFLVTWKLCWSHYSEIWKLGGHLLSSVTKGSSIAKIGSRHEHCTLSQFSIICLASVGNCCCLGSQGNNNSIKPQQRCKTEQQQQHTPKMCPAISAQTSSKRKKERTTCCLK